MSPSLPAATDLSVMLLLGLLGTGHCIGMCGPLVIAFPAQTGKMVAHLMYHMGRITTYTLMGGALGAAAGTFADLSAAVSIQVVLSFIAAIFLLWFGLIRLGAIGEPRFMSGISPHRFWGFRSAVKAANRGNSFAQFPIGFAMGLIPCGLSYAAFARAITEGSALKGAALLFAFGIGTLPGLFLLGTALSRIFSKHRALFDILAAVVMFAMGAKLIVNLFG